MTPLCDLARKHGTDKGGWHQTHGRFCHEYTPAYHQFLASRRHEVRRVLEVGVHYGCSLRMWAEYFPQAEIVGLDVYEPHLFTDGRITCHYADQGKPLTLMAAVQAAGGGPFDLIIDDGSHDYGHQVTTANVLLPYLAAGGVYAVEDIRPPCQYLRLATQIVSPAGVNFRGIPTGRGLGGLGCPPSCQHCHGSTDEVLLIFEREAV